MPDTPGLRIPYFGCPHLVIPGPLPASSAVEPGIQPLLLLSGALGTWIDSRQSMRSSSGLPAVFAFAFLQNAVGFAFGRPGMTKYC
jgi:hypothetical protein